MPKNLSLFIMETLELLPDAKRFEIWRKLRDKYVSVLCKGEDTTWSRQLSSIAYVAYMWDK